MNSLEFRFEDYINIVQRRKWLILSVILGTMVIATVLCFVLPESFRSTTTVLVEGQKIPESYVKSVVEGTIEGRLSSIQQVVMSRSLLSQIAEEFKLYRSDMSPEDRESVLSSMRKSIKVTTAETGHAKGRNTIEAFSISFAHKDPAIAMRITERFASQFIEQNLRIREQIVEGASDFLEQELRMAKERLEEQERSISSFKSQYMGELPQQMEANLQIGRAHV